MDSMTISEELMQRGWWDDALKIINRPDVAPSDRTLQTAALTCRRECVAYLLSQDIINLSFPDLQSILLNRFDRFTVRWVLNDYIGVGSLVWGKRKKDNGLTD